MRRPYLKNIITFATVLLLFVAAARAGWFKSQSPKWGSESGTVSDTLLAATGKDTTTTWDLQLKTGNGVGRETAREVGIKWKLQETHTSDSGKVYLYVDVSDDGTNFYPWDGSVTGLADSIDLSGTAKETGYGSVRLVSIVPGKYMRGRAVAAGTSTDSVWVSDFDVTLLYYD